MEVNDPVSSSLSGRGFPRARVSTVPPLRPAKEAPKTVLKTLLLLSGACPGTNARKPQSSNSIPSSSSRKHATGKESPERWLRQPSFILRILQSLQTALNYLPWLLCGAFSQFFSVPALSHETRPLPCCTIVPKVLLFWYGMLQKGNNILFLMFSCEIRHLITLTWWAQGHFFIVLEKIDMPHIDGTISMWRHVGMKNASTIPYCGQYAFQMFVSMCVTNGIIVESRPLTYD